MTLLVVLALIASWRLARLVAVDEITRPLREWIISKAGPESQIAYGITCSWCASIWLSIPVAALVVYFPDNRGVWLGLIALAGSAVAGLMQGIEDRIDR